ncbi:MAG: RNA polymerase sigma factor [Chloroflexi bacterium]|nr:RNA polymerase sigma factor [Chloroflexota bacterium]
MANDGNQAFERLVDRHAGDIHGLAAAIVGIDHAGDVTQDVLFLAWRKLPSLRDPDRTAAWLRRIVVNRCVDHGRRAGREVRTIPILDGLDPRQRRASLETTGYDPELDRALRSLPVEQRAVLALHYAADLTIADVAATLDVPVGTAKSRLNAALTRLRSELGERRP